jgi:signal transduction histidine kinase
MSSAARARPHLLTLDRPRRRGAPWADLLVIPAFLLALVAFNGYVYGAFSLVDLPLVHHASGMSLPVTLGVLALCTGTLCARPEQGLMARLTGGTLGGLFARLLLPLLLLLPPMTGVLLELLHVLGPLSGAAENALFSTVTSASGLAIALFSAGVLDRLDTQRKHAEAERERLKEEYVGLISHDLRTPLQNLSLRLELLLRQLRARELETEAATAESLQRSVQRMGGMIDELLEGTRLESGRVELDRAPVELRGLLAEVLERDVPPSERERFRLEGPAAPRPVLADAARLTRVVVNLLTNALKYSPPGSPVEVRLVDEEARVVVTVRDQGPGLRPEEAAHLFQKYYRTRSTARKSEGLGLGLYISRLIVEAHGGRIWVESLPGQGAAFSFCLPREPPGPPAAREVR